VVSKVLLEVLYGIFNESFLNKNVDKLKNVKKRKNVTGIKKYIYGVNIFKNSKLWCTKRQR